MKPLLHTNTEKMTMGIGLRQLIFVICCASITGLSYLLSYVYIVILTRFMGNQSLWYISLGAIAQWALSSVLAHFIFLIYNKVRYVRKIPLLVSPF